LRSRDVLCSGVGVKCQTDGCFSGRGLQVQPSFQASESRCAGGGGHQCLEFDRVGEKVITGFEVGCMVNPSSSVFGEGVYGLCFDEFQVLRVGRCVV